MTSSDTSAVSGRADGRSPLRPAPDSRSATNKRANAGWVLTVYPAAYEASGGFQASARRSAGPAASSPVDPDTLARRSKEAAARRATGKVRRYAVANGLNRLGTLTYGGDGQHDPHLLRQHVNVFFKRLRASLGSKPFPYVWVPEMHSGGHGLHIHFAVGRFVQRSLIDAAWGHGFVHIKLLSDGGIGAAPQRQREAATAARYLAKYVGKDFGLRPGGLHRYEVARGFQPAPVRVWGRSEGEVIGAAADVMRGMPSYLWRSNLTEGWEGPPSLWMSWL